VERGVVVEVSVLVQYGIKLSLEEVDKQLSEMQDIIFSQCSFVGDEQFKCVPNDEVMSMFQDHIPLGEPLEPEVLSTILLDLAEDLALWILREASTDLEPRLAGLFAYDFIYQSLQSMFSVDLFDEDELEQSPSRDRDDPMFA